MYDAIGSHERVPQAANGSGGHQVMSVLDSQVRSASRLLAPNFVKIFVQTSTRYLNLLLLKFSPGHGCL